MDSHYGGCRGRFRPRATRNGRERLRTSVPAAQRHRRYAVCSGFEIARPVEIGNQPRLLRLPSQQFPSSLTRGRVVNRCEMREPAKVAGCFLGVLADDRHVTGRRPGHRSAHLAQKSACVSVRMATAGRVAGSVVSDAERPFRTIPDGHKVARTCAESQKPLRFNACIDRSAQVSDAL